MIPRRIHSKQLEGLVEDHGDHREQAPMHSTGDLVLIFGEAEDARNWFVEFRCDICKELVHEWHADLQDLIWGALKENGILNHCGTE